MYCPRCRRPLDAKTGLCPYCEAAAIENLNRYNAAEKAKRDKKIIIAVMCVVGALLVAAAVIGVILIFNKMGEKAPDNDYAHDVKSTYVSYVKDVLEPEYGEFNLENPEKGQAGIYSVLFTDFDKDSNEEMVVAYTEKNGNKYDVKLDCYTCSKSVSHPKNKSQKDNNQKETTKSDSNGPKNKNPENGVTPIGSVTAKTIVEPDPEAPTLPSEKILYSVEYEGKTYIIYEFLEWFEGYEYEAHVFTLKNGALTEVSNIIVPLLGSDGIELTYSNKLPEKMKIDNSDFDFNNRDSDSFLRDNYLNNNGIILYYQEGGGSDFVYDSHFKSTQEAVKEFFKCYGVERNGDVIWNDSNDGGALISIERPKNANYLYSYVNYNDHYEFTDFTDWKKLVEKQESKDEPEENLNKNIAAEQGLSKDEMHSVLNKAAKFTSDFFNDKNYDFNKTKKYNTGEWEVDCFLMKSDKIKTWDDYVKSGENMYTKEAINDYLENDMQIPHIDADDGLYVFYDGLGGGDDYPVFIYEKVSDEQYKLTLYHFFSGEVTTEEYNLTENGDKWILDKMIPYYIYDNAFKFKLVDKGNAKEYEKFNQLNAYSKCIDEEYDDNTDIDSFKYFIYDMNKDGVNELIILQSSGVNIYTYKDGKCEDIGGDGGVFSNAYLNKRTGVFALFRGGSEGYRITEFSYDSGKVNEKTFEHEGSWSPDDKTGLLSNYEGIKLYENYEREHLHNAIFPE